MSQQDSAVFHVCSHRMDSCLWILLRAQRAPLNILSWPAPAHHDGLRNISCRSRRGSLVRVGSPACACQRGMMRGVGGIRGPHRLAMHLGLAPVGRSTAEGTSAPRAKRSTCSRLAGPSARPSTRVCWRRCVALVDPPLKAVGHVLGAGHTGPCFHFARMSSDPHLNLRLMRPSGVMIWSGGMGCSRCQYLIIQFGGEAPF